MSLTNPKNVVTEERLSEFYGEILPYLGGMPEVLANKFSKADLYSTNEKIVGCWTDGRPIYQKTFIDVPFVKLSGVTANRAYATLFNPTDAANLNLIGYDGLLLKNSSGDKLSLGTMLTGNTNYSTQEVYQAWSVLQNSDFGIVVSTIRNDSGAITGRTATVTIRYTKTTDAANSFKYGNETDYSTDEKMVGTWIDGKPLYQKTISTTLPTITTDGTTADKAIDLGDLNIKYAEVVGGSAYYSDGHAWGIPINSSWGAGTAGAKYFIRTQVNYTGITGKISLILQANRSIYSDAPMYATIRYTKTTD